MIPCWFGKPARAGRTGSSYCASKNTTGKEIPFDYKILKFGYNCLLRAWQFCIYKKQ